jgi:glutamate racemase
MLGSAELVEMAEAKLHGKAVSLDELRRILRPWLRMPEPGYRCAGLHPLPAITGRVVRGAAGGTRLVDSGAATRRTAWLLVYEAPDAKSADANIAFCMAIPTEQLLPVLRRYGFETLEKLAL